MCGFFLLRLYLYETYVFPLDRDQHIETLSTDINKVIETNAELSLSKVKLEMKAVELEELKDR